MWFSRGRAEVYQPLDTWPLKYYDVYAVMYNTQGRQLMERTPDDSKSDSPAMILRAGLRQARLERLGGEALDGSGFENEIAEADFDEWE